MALVLVAAMMYGAVNNKVDHMYEEQRNAELRKQIHVSRMYEEQRDELRQLRKQIKQDQERMEEMQRSHKEQIQNLMGWTKFVGSIALVDIFPRTWNTLRPKNRQEIFCTEAPRCTRALTESRRQVENAISMKSWNKSSAAWVSLCFCVLWSIRRRWRPPHPRHPPVQARLMIANRQDAIPAAEGLPYQPEGGSSSDRDSDSASSWLFVDQECCYLPSHLFMVHAENGEQVPMFAGQLRAGTQVVAANGEVVTVRYTPEEHQASEVIKLEAGNACLVVSPEHRIPIPGGGTVKARELSFGMHVFLQGEVQAPLTSVYRKQETTRVLKIAFTPDLHVCGFMTLPGIQSKGWRKKQLRRSMRTRPIDADNVSLPATGGYLTD